MGDVVRFPISVKTILVKILRFKRDLIHFKAQKKRFISIKCYKHLNYVIFKLVNEH